MADHEPAPGNWRWPYGIAAGAAAMIALGLWLAVACEAGIDDLLSGKAGTAAAVTVVSALVLGSLKTGIDWRRRAAGRPPLRGGRLAVGVVAFQLAALLALAALAPAWLLSWLAGANFAPHLADAAVTVLVGSTLAALAAGALRDLLQLIGALAGHGKGRPSSPSVRPEAPNVQKRRSAAIDSNRNAEDR